MQKLVAKQRTMFRARARAQVPDRARGRAELRRETLIRKFSKPLNKDGADS